MNRTFFDKKNKVWHGRLTTPLYNPNVSIGQVVLDALSKNPNKIGQINDFTGKQLKNAQIRLMTIRVAQNLQSNGFTKSAVAGLYVSNFDELASVVFGCMTVGIAVNPINPYYIKDEIVHMFTLTKPSLVFCEEENLSTLKEALEELKSNVPIFVFGNSTASGVRSVDELLKPNENETYYVPPHLRDGTKEIALIHCSSGTTGMSKAVCLSHASFLAQYGLVTGSCDDVILNYSTLYWISGSMILLRGTLIGATRIITTEPFSPESMVKHIEKYKVTMCVTPPSYLAQLLDHPQIKTAKISSLREYACGGSFVHPHLRKSMNNILPAGRVCIMYGMTEAAGITHFTNAESDLGAVGQTADGMYVKIVDEDGNRCGISVEGEVRMKTIYPFLGYVGGEDETKNLFDDEGFIRTGDIGKYDVNGDLHVIGRIKDILKYKNNQIPPSEIEKVILSHPGVQDVCVVGIPDMICTDLPAAVVVKSDVGNVTQDDIHTLVKEKLSNPKQLRGGVYFVDAFPITSTGKILRRKVQDVAVNFYHMDSNIGHN